MSLVKGLSILFIFSKNQLLDLLILWIVLLVSMSFNSALTLLFLSSYSLWDLFLFFPPVLINVGLGCLFDMFLSFLGRPVLLWRSLSRLPSLCPIGFGLLCVHFQLFPESFWFLPWSNYLPIHCLIACYSISMSWNVFEFFPWSWFLTSSPCGPGKCLIWFQFSWVCWGLFCVLSCDIPLKMFLHVIHFL